MADPEVTAKLRVTREGDPKAFSEVGDAATDLASRVREAAPDLDRYASTLDDLASSAKQSAPDVAEATGALADGIRNLSRSASEGDVKTSLTDIIEAIEKLSEIGGDEAGSLVEGLGALPEVLSTVRDGITDLQTGLEDAGAAAAKIEIPAGVAPGLDAISGGVGRLREAVAGLDGPVAGFGETIRSLRLPLAESSKALEEVADRARDTAPAVAEAADEMSSSLERLDNAGTLEEFEAGLEAARVGLEALRDSGIESVEGLEEQVEHLDEALQGLAKTIEKIDEPLADAFEAAGAKVEDFARKAEAGLGSSKTAGAAAQRAISDLEAEIRRLEAAGSNISAGQVAELEKLKAAHQAAVEEVAKNTLAQERFAKQSDETSRAMSGQIKPIRDVGDLLEGINPQFARTAAKVGLVFEAVKVGADVLDGVQAHLNRVAKELGGTGDEFEGLFDGLGKVIPGFERSVNLAVLAITDFEEYLRKTNAPMADWSDQTEELANLQKILRSEGIDPSNLSLQEAREKYAQVAAQIQKTRSDLAALKETIFGNTKEWERHLEAVEGLRRTYPSTVGLASGQLASLKKILQDVADQAIENGRELPEGLRAYARELGVATTEAEQFAAAQKKVAESQHLTVESVRTSAKETLGLIGQVIEQNRNLLSDADLGELLKKPIQEVIDQAENLGLSLAELSPSLAANAEHWGIVGTAAEKAAKKYTDAVDGIVEKITGLSSSKKELEELGHQIVDAAKQLGNLDALEFKNPEAFGRLKEEVQGVVDAYLALGEKVPKALTDLGDQVGVFVGNMDRATTAQAAFAAGGDEIAGRAASVAGAVNQESEAVAGLASATEEASRRTASASASGAAAVVQAGQVMSASAEATKVKTRITADGQIEIYNDLGVGAATMATQVADAGKTAAEGAAGFEAVGKAADKARQLKGLGEAAKTAGSDIKAGGDEAGGSKEGYGAVADEVAKLGDAGATAAEKLRGLKEEIAAIGPVVTTLRTDVDGLITALDGMPARWHAAIVATMADIDLLAAKLDQLQDDAEAVANAPGVAA